MLGVVAADVKDDRRKLVVLLLLLLQFDGAAAHEHARSPRQQRLAKNSSLGRRTGFHAQQTTLHTTRLLTPHSLLPPNHREHRKRTYKRTRCTDTEYTTPINRIALGLGHWYPVAVKTGREALIWTASFMDFVILRTSRFSSIISM